MDFKNKLFMFLLIVSFISMSSVSALEFDNVKAYDSVTREVTITNAFGLGDEIGKARLNTPLNVKVGAGYQKVAEFDLWAYEDYNNALKQFSFEDMKQGRKKINRDYDLKYLTHEKIEVDDYELDCFNSTTINGTKTSYCNKIITGSHTEIKEVWKKITPADLKKNDRLTVGVFTDVKNGDYVDWIPTIYGVEVKEWATWEYSVIQSPQDMTSNILPTPYVVTADSNDGSGAIWKAFDGVSEYLGWSSTAHGQPWWIQIDFGEGNKFIATNFSNDYTNTLGSSRFKDYTFQGSNDNSIWNTLETVTGQPNTASLFKYDFIENIIAYRYYKWVATSIQGGTSGTASIDELIIYGYLEDVDLSPNITLNSPTSANYTTNQNLNINFTAWDDINLTDVKLYVNDILNQTNASGINNSNYIFDLELGDGNFTIYGRATDNESQTTNSSEITIFIDTIEPVINVSSPLDFVIGSDGDILNLNWTATDLYLESCWYNYNSTITLVNCSENTTTIIYETGNNNLTFYANDTLGNIGSKFYSWNSYLSINELSYDALIYETGNTTIGLNLSYDISDLAVTGLIEYNGVNYSTIKAVETGGTYFSKAFNIGVGRVGEVNNFTFHFIITDGFTGTTSTEEYNQTITETYLGYCNATYSTTALNFTFWDEDAGTVINASANPTTFEGSFVYWIGDGSYTKNFSISDFNQTNSSYPICISPNNSIKTNLALSYGATGYNSNSYHLSGASLTNSSSETKLWLLPDTIGSKFFISSFYGISSLNGATITATKYFSGEGVYKTTGIALTDSSGKFSMYLDHDKSYRFYAVSDGESLGYVEKGAFCETAPCEMSLQFFAESSDLLDGYNDLYAGDVVYQLYFNSTTDLANAVFSDTTGTANYFRFEVARVSLNNTDLVICDQTLYTTSGAMFCNMSGLTGNYQATLLVSRSPEKVIDIIQFIVGGLQDALGTTGLIVALFFLIIIVFSGLRNPVIAVALVPIALVSLKLIDILPISWLWISSITVLAIILIGRLKT